MHVVIELVVVLRAVLRPMPQSYSNWHIKSKIIGIYRRCDMSEFVLNNDNNKSWINDGHRN